MSSLQHLGLSHNQLQSVPPQIRHLTRLVELDLDYNHIGPELPEEMAYLVRLQRLGLTANRLAKEQEFLSRLPLTSLRLSGNRNTGYVVKDPVTNEVIDGANIPVSLRLRYFFISIVDKLFVLDETRRLFAIT